MITLGEINELRKRQFQWGLCFFIFIIFTKNKIFTYYLCKIYKMHIITYEISASELVLATTKHHGSSCG